MGESDFRSDVLHAEEKALIQHASEKRVLEFTLGRIAARKSLAALGRELNAPLLRGDRGQPLWPNGIRGAITHTRSIAAAATTCSPNVKAIGLDLEYLDRETDRKVANRICVDSERTWVNSNDDLLKKRILQIFSAKEAFYKAVNPHVGVPIYYSDVELRHEDEAQSFVGLLLRDLSDDFQKSFEFRIFSHEAEGILLSHLTLLN